MERAALQGREALGDELAAAVDEPRLLGAVLFRPSRNVGVVGLVGLAEVGGIRVGNRAALTHPVDRGARVQPAGKRDTDFLAGRKGLQDHRNRVKATSTRR